MQVQPLYSVRKSAIGSGMLLLQILCHHVENVFCFGSRTRP